VAFSDGHVGACKGKSPSGRKVQEPGAEEPGAEPGAAASAACKVALTLPVPHLPPFIPAALTASRTPTSVRRAAVAWASRARGSAADARAREDGAARQAASHSLWFSLRFGKQDLGDHFHEGEQ